MTKEEHYIKIIKTLNDAIKTNPRLKFETLLFELVNYYKSSFSYMDWVGFYLYDKEDPSLYLGPYIGDDACEYIPLKNGVCGKAYTTKESQLVKNVHELSYHIACSSSTNSELVVPLLFHNDCVAVFDLDSDQFEAFDEIDLKYTEEICHLITTLCK